MSQSTSEAVCDIPLLTARPPPSLYPHTRLRFPPVCHRRMTHFPFRHPRPCCPLVPHCLPHFLRLTFSLSSSRLLIPSPPVCSHCRLTCHPCYHCHHCLFMLRPLPHLCLPPSCSCHYRSQGCSLSTACVQHPVTPLFLLHFLSHHHLDRPIPCHQAQSNSSHHHQLPASRQHFLPYYSIARPCRFKAVHFTSLPLLPCMPVPFPYSCRCSDLPILHRSPQLNHSRRHHLFQVPPRPPMLSQHTTKPTVQSSQHMCSNLKTNMDHTPSTGATANAFKNATTNTDTPSLHLILEASPTVATGRTSRENATLTLCSTHHAAAAAEPKSKENS
jgi:hypothetical protein